jgi:hypothetical protein
MIALLSGIGISVVIALTCVAAWLVGRRRVRGARLRAARELLRPTHHTGAWMIRVKPERARLIALHMNDLVRRHDTPACVAEVLKGAGGTIIEHLPGPGFEGALPARAWLGTVVRRFATTRLESFDTSDVVVLAYASAAAPPMSCRLDALQDYMEEAISVAVVTCRNRGERAASPRAPWSTYLGAVATGVALLLAAIALSSDVRTRASAGSPVSPPPSATAAQASLSPPPGQPSAQPTQEQQAPDPRVESGSHAKAGGPKSPRQPARSPTPQGSNDGKALRASGAEAVGKPPVAPSSATATVPTVAPAPTATAPPDLQQQDKGGSPVPSNKTSHELGPR